MRDKLLVAIVLGASIGIVIAWLWGMVTYTKLGGM